MMCCPLACRPQTGWNQKVNDADYRLPHKQPSKRLFTILNYYYKLPHYTLQVSSVQFISVTQSCPTLCDPMDCSTPVFPVRHQLHELAQTHVHWVDDTIQPSHPLLSPSSPAFTLSQHGGLFQWVSSSHQVAWSFSFNISPSNEYSGLHSFRSDW